MSFNHRGLRVPELAVIIPAYNAEAVIGEQIAALTGEPAPFSWELIVADNGSTDGTAALVARLAESIPQLRLVDASARRGPAAARNQGAAATHAPSIAFCDADDVVAPGWVRAARDGLERYAFITGYQTALGNGRRSGPHASRHLPWLPYTGAGSMGIRRDVFEAAGGFDETLITDEDNDLSWRIQLAGHRLTFLEGMSIGVRPRSTVRAAFRQAYSWGANERQLVHKFELVIAAYERQTGQRVPRVSRLSDGAKGLTAAAVSAYRIARTPTTENRVALAYVPGARLGQSLGRVDRSRPQLPVPPGELPVWTALEPDRTSDLARS